MNRAIVAYRYLALLTLSCALLLSGCAGLDAGRDFISGLSESLFGDDDNADPPAPITEYTPEVQIDTVWQTSVGDGAAGQFLKLTTVNRDGRLYVAERNGTVEAHNTSNGELLWRTETDYQISAGPALGLQSLVIGTSQGQVVAFDAFNGEQKWVTPVPSEVLAQPIFARNSVIVRTSDGEIMALREADGGTLWRVEHSVPALSLRGASRPLITDNSIIVGHASGKLEALQLRDGKSLWEATIAMPTGRSEVERLVDLDADPVENRSFAFVSSYQGGTAAVSPLDGDITWRNKDVSAYTPLAADFRHLYLSNLSSEVLQLDQRSGSALWKQTELRNRRLTGPAVYQNYIVVGDYEGYVHWLSQSDGRLLGRSKVSGGPIEVTPLVVDDTVIIYAKDGTLAALRAH